MTMSKIESTAKKAIRLAKEEIEGEVLKKAVSKLKELYRQETAANTVLKNVQREIKELELAIEQGNVDE